MNFNELVSAFFIPVLYAAIAGFLAGIVLYIFALKRMKYTVRNYYGARKAFLFTFIPLSLISFYFLVVEDKKLLDLNNDWLNVGLL